jgi:uncharacterized protein YecE (DUF72 family)
VIRVGIGGWTYPPWRGVFYPAGLAHAAELDYASRHVTSIEINATFYRLHKPETFRKWADSTPDDFVFSVKAPRLVTNRRVLAEAAPAIERFLASGLTELGDKLGPILWQFPPTKRFDEADVAGFLELLPARFAGRTLRHAVEVRHDSFRVPALVALLHRHRIPVVYSDSDDYPAIADVTGDFIYARLQRTIETVATGYGQPALDQWAERIERWAAGHVPADLSSVEAPPPARPRDCFIYVIDGAKLRAPAAAMELLARLQR